jgi:hypothetical protein
VRNGVRLSLFVAFGCLFVGSGAALSASGNGDRPDPEAVAAHWNEARKASAIPRDLVIDHRGLGYLRGRNGELSPYGHDIPAEPKEVRALSKPTPAGKPGGSGGGDTTPPSISEMSPSGGTIGAEHTFSAKVTDASGVKSVSFTIEYPSGATQSFGASRGANDVWSVAFTGFTDGNWRWRVVAKDYGAKGGNTATSAWVAFTVGTGGGGGGGGSVVTNAQWAGGTVETAAGRIYFEMPANRRLTKWTAYVCSGTAVTDSSGNSVSVILTAAHCVYDDVYKAFARNVLFIPKQWGTTGSGTDTNCSNDPLGCWATSHGVVDSDWSSRKWPNNIPWDYAYYVVPISGAHTGAGAYTSLESAAGTLPISFSAPSVGSAADALGYSYSEDPKLMYCTEALGTEGSSNWWLSQCGLSGGSSGGPWLQPVNGGDGPVISVNSWGYSGSPGMAGPMLADTSAQCLFGAAQGSAAPVNGGVIPDC